MKILSVIAFTLLCTFSMSDQAFAATSKSIVCASKTGVLLVRQNRCNRGETQVSLGILQGQAGQPGPKGDQGEPGPQGNIGVSGRNVVSNPVFNLGINAFAGTTFSVTCPGTTKALGGGCISFNGAVVVKGTYPNDEVFNGTSRWTCEFINVTGSQVSASFSAFAVCANVDS